MKTIATCFATLLSTAALAAPPGAGDVGRFVYDQSGAVIGSLTAIQGSDAVISDGLMFHPGYRLVTIPGDAIEVQAGRVVLTGMTMAQIGRQRPVSLARR